MHNRVDHVGRLVVGGLDDEGEPLGVRGDEGGEMRDDGQGGPWCRCACLLPAQHGRTSVFTSEAALTATEAAQIVIRSAAELVQEAKMARIQQLKISQTDVF